MSWLAFAFTYLALVAFALAMKVHHVAVFRTTPSEIRQRTFRFVGIALAAAALACLRVHLGWQIGLVAWIAMAGVGGFLMSQLLAAFPRWVPIPALGLLAVAVLATG